MLTLNLFGKNPCVMGRTHHNCQLPSFLSSLLNHLFYQKVIQVVIAWNGKSMGKFELGRAPSSGMSCFSCRDKKTPEPYVSLTHAFTPSFLLSRLESCGTFGLITIIQSFITYTPRSSCGSRENNRAFLLCMYPLHSASMLLLDMVVFFVLQCYPKL